MLEKTGNRLFLSHVRQERWEKQRMMERAEEGQEDSRNKNTNSRNPCYLPLARQLCVSPPNASAALVFSAGGVTRYGSIARPKDGQSGARGTRISCSTRLRYFLFQRICEQLCNSEQHVRTVLYNYVPRPLLIRHRTNRLAARLKAAKSLTILRTCSKR